MHLNMNPSELLKGVSLFWKSLRNKWTLEGSTGKKVLNKGLLNLANKSELLKFKQFNPILPLSQI